MIMKVLTASLLLLLAYNCTAQQDSTTKAVNDSVLQSPRTVRTFTITGANRTKDYMVKREFAFQINETYTVADLRGRMELTRQQLMNTSLFVSVTVDTFEVGIDEVGIAIEVKERWYIFPIPFFKIVDRNWNEWIKQHDANLNRVNYGLRIKHANLSGRNDRLSFSLVSGYTREFSVGYSAPYLDNKLQQGLNMGFRYARNREVNYMTRNDTIINMKLDNFASTQVSGYIGYSYRRGSKERHNVRLGYNDIRIDSQIAKLNPDYFGFRRQKASFLDLTYSFQYFNVDFIPYPLTGWYTDVYANQRIGKNLSYFSVGGKFLQSWKLTSGTYFMFQAAGSIKFPFNQPYYNNRLMGYGDITMRGLEYNIIDGAAGGMIRGTLRKKVLGFILKTPFKNSAYSRIPFNFYAKVFTDAGYVYNKNPGNSRLANRRLHTGGFGLDILSIYDVAIKLEFSFNQLGGRGLFVHSSSDF
jgi:outer membrane protein assembly factor BamA